MRLEFCATVGPESLRRRHLLGFSINEPQDEDDGFWRRHGGPEEPVGGFDSSSIRGDFEGQEWLDKAPPPPLI